MSSPAQARLDPFSRRRNVALSLLGNLLGALLTEGYFVYVDTAGFGRPDVSLGSELAFFAIAFGLIALVGAVFSIRWTDPIVAAAARLRRGERLDAHESAVARRRALMLPLGTAAITFAGWVLAGITFGVVRPLVFGDFSVTESLRMLLGIVGIAGSIATAFIFLSVERRWRRELPAFFPEGRLGEAATAPGLSVRARLLGVFLLVGVLPVSVLGMAAYRRAHALLGAGPEDAAGLVHGLTLVTAFLVAVGVTAAVGLAMLVARSVAGPLGRLEAAMAEVGRGRLDASCPVVSHDEIGVLTDGFNRMLDGLRERDAIKTTFGKYVTEEIRDEILAGRVALEGQQHEVTLLFADLRDFTPWVEATPPRDVVRDLNEYFTEMEQAIRRHRGLVVQFIGDEIEAVFGAPVIFADHADRAVHAALEMRERLAAWNARRVAHGKPAMRHGIGIHTGTVLAGNIGSAERLSYALVGDAVNLASRIQGLTKDFAADILVSGDTRARLAGGVAVERLPAVRVKGRSAEVEVYRVP